MRAGSRARARRRRSPSPGRRSDLRHTQIRSYAADRTASAAPDERQPWLRFQVARYWSGAPFPRRGARRRPRRAGRLRASVPRRPRREVALPDANRAAVDGRPHHHRLEPGLPLGSAPRGADTSVRPDADARDRHVVVPEQARSNNSPGNRTRAGRRVSLRLEPGGRAVGAADLPAALRRDERSLERLLRLHRERAFEGRVAYNRVVPEGVRARLPPRARGPGSRGQRTAQAARATSGSYRPRSEPVPDPAGDLESAGRR